MLYVIVDKVYAIKVVGECVCVGSGGLYSFDGNEYGVKFYPLNVLVSW